MSHILIWGVVLVVVLANSVESQWKKADLTNYESYPDCCEDKNADQTECEDYNACKYKGDFAFCGHKSKSWVQQNNIISINKKDAKKYKLKTFEIRKGSKTIRAKVCDECSDSDCNGCCTKNSKKSGFLIDMEINTVKRFGAGDGVVDWKCVDC